MDDCKSSLRVQCTCGTLGFFNILVNNDRVDFNCWCPDCNNQETINVDGATVYKVMHGS
jgi:hypothetical protein